MKRVKQYLALGLAIFMTSTEVFTTPMMSVAAEVTASVEETSTEETKSEEVVETADEEENVADEEQSEKESESKAEDDTANTKESESLENSEETEIKEVESEESDSETEETETEEITETEIEEVAVALFAMDLSENQYINYATEWKYLDNDTDPAGSGDRTSWTLDGFDDSSWKTNAGVEAKFGAKRGVIADLGNNSTPTVLLNQYNEAGGNVKTFFFRSSFTLSEIPENVEVVGKLKYDDAAIVYINGKKVAAFDEPTGGFSSNLEYGGSNAGEPKDASFSIDADCLKVGNNVIAVEVHQGREASSDIYFEMSSLELVESETESTVETAATQKAVALAVGADETSRNITWYADAEVAGKVQYAVKTGDTFPKNYTEVEADVQAANETGFYSNQATLGNLAYDTEYVYRLVNGEKVSETYSFKTGSKDSFSFLLAGDPQIGSGSIEVGIAGWENTLNLAMEKFPEADFLLSAGDQVNTASNEQQYAGYLEHDALKSLPMANVIGNHDSASDSYSQHFNNPNETTYGATTAGVDYWYVYNNTLFMILNSNNMSAAEHKTFMEEAIAANPDVDWKIVSFHHSLYSVANHAFDDGILARREQWVPILDELDVDVVLMGHDHVYARTYIMDGFAPEITETVENSTTNPDGILYITANSASGSKFYAIKNETFDYAAVQSQERVPNISNVEVTENSFKITTYRTSDMSVVDTFEIIHDDSADSGEETEWKEEVIDYNTTWKYLDNDTDPAGSDDRTSWTLDGFDDSSWKTNAGIEAKFGAKNGAIADLGNNSTPTVLLNQYNEAGKNVKTFFFRTAFNLSEVPENMEVIGELKYDDAAIVYINGKKVAAFDEPTGGFASNLEYGGSNAGAPQNVKFQVSAECLKTGKNIVAVEIHQGREASSDVYFEMSSLKIKEDIPVVTATTQKAVALAVGADETSRNITWYADAEVAGKVQYAVKTGDNFPENYTEVEADVQAANETDYYSNQATLGNLAYDTEYVYRLVNGEKVSETYSFKTGSKDSFSFLLAGDPQIGAGSTESDIAGWENTLNLATEKFPEADFLLSAGDQVNTASNEQQYAGYLEHDALKSLPMATVIGNHDSSSNSYSQHFNNPNETTYGATTAGVDYWYVYNNTLFMILNSNNMSAAEHKTFMEEAIAANPDVDWKIVSFHHSLYTVASHAYDNDILARRDQWVPIFDELDVDVVLMGHDHVYARTYIMDGFTPEVTETVENSTTNPDGILYITANSASGSKFYGIKNETFDYAAVQSQERVPNISNVEVTENSFKITTYRTSDMSVVDTFEIIHKEEIGKGDVPATSTDTETTSNSSSDDSSVSTTTVATSATVQIPEMQTPLSGTLVDGMQYDAVNLENSNKLRAELLQKYLGKHMYLMVYANAGIGFSIDTTSIGNDVKDVALQSKMEKLPEFAQGFDTIKVTAAKEGVLPFNMDIHVNVGNENIGKTAYIFKKSLVTGAYELGKTMTVNEIGNVALKTNEFADIMVLVAK